MPLQQICANLTSQRKECCCGRQWLRWRHIRRRRSRRRRLTELVRQLLRMATTTDQPGDIPDSTDSVADDAGQCQLNQPNAAGGLLTWSYSVAIAAAETEVL